MVLVAKALRKHNNNNNNNGRNFAAIMNTFSCYSTHFCFFEKGWKEKNKKIMQVVPLDTLKEKMGCPQKCLCYSSRKCFLLLPMPLQCS